MNQLLMGGIKVHSLFTLSIFNVYLFDANSDIILGHCHACKGYRPMMVHPSSRAYGGGNTTCIGYPNDDSSSSDSDYESNSILMMRSQTM